MPKTEQAYERVRDASRRKILDAALKVFAEKGSEATMADVAMEAGVSQGLAYRYFLNKEDILAILVKEAAESGGGPAERLKNISGTPGERLRLLLTYIIYARRERPIFYQFLYRVLKDELAPKDLRESVAKNGKVVRDALRQLIVEAQSKGEIADDDPDQLLVALLSSIEGLVNQMSGPWASEDSKHSPDARIFLRMLEPKDAERGTGRS